MRVHCFTGFIMVTLPPKVIWTLNSLDKLEGPAVRFPSTSISSVNVCGADIYADVWNDSDIFVPLPRENSPVIFVLMNSSFQEFLKLKF